MITFKTRIGDHFLTECSALQCVDLSYTALQRVGHMFANDCPRLTTLRLQVGNLSNTSLLICRLFLVLSLSNVASYKGELSMWASRACQRRILHQYSQGKRERRERASRMRSVEGGRMMMTQRKRESPTRKQGKRKTRNLTMRSLTRNLTSPLRCRYPYHFHCRGSFRNPSRSGPGI